jgi:hypothetical protein|tara:strand:- start:5552 stop:5839 length:288 start_codon:yes stop_codon:yes gene_type:complete
MANKIVKYKLEANGTIPTWIYDGGYYPTSEEVMIGATVDGSAEAGLGELASEADVKTYLDSYTSTWTEQDPSDPSATVPFDQAAAATYIWSKKVD